MYALRIVSTDKILRFKNTNVYYLMIVIVGSGCSLSLLSSSSSFPLVLPVRRFVVRLLLVLILCVLIRLLYVGVLALRASLSGTFLQTLPDLVTPLKGYSLSPRSCPPTRSAPSERFGY